eukprot:208276-Pleurochrysis_carterae.AAC.5
MLHSILPSDPTFTPSTCRLSAEHRLKPLLSSACSAASRHAVSNPPPTCSPPLPSSLVALDHPSLHRSSLTRQPPQSGLTRQMAPTCFALSSKA